MTRLAHHPAPRVGALGVGIGLILAAAGAFGTADAPFLGRAAWFTASAVTLSFIGYGVDYALRGDARLADRRPLRLALVAAVMTVLTTLISFGFSMAAGGARWDDLPGYLMISLVMSAAITGLAFALFRDRPDEAEAPSGPPRFLDRLPPKLRGADIWAVEAEDHYLRLHTSKGQDLILMRLSDAVTELAGIEGVQVHRSWWVARAAVTDIKRGDGRAVLTLKDGSQAPVSRTYAARLRDLGWV